MLSRHEFWDFSGEISHEHSLIVLVSNVFCRIFILVRRFSTQKNLKISTSDRGVVWDFPCKIKGFHEISQRKPFILQGISQKISEPEAGERGLSIVRLFRPGPTGFLLIMVQKVSRNTPEQVLRTFTPPPLAMCSPLLPSPDKIQLPQKPEKVFLNYF